MPSPTLIAAIEFDYEQYLIENKPHNTLRRIDYTNKINTYAARFVLEVEGFNATSQYHINIHAESFLIPVLNEVFNLKLKNLNATQGRNFPAIDLADFENRVAFQITATTTNDKIKDTLEKFKKNNLHLQFDSLYIYIITEKKERYPQEVFNALLSEGYVFDVNEHIIDKDSLLQKINGISSTPKLELLSNIFEREFSDSKIGAGTGSKHHYNSQLRSIESFIKDFKTTSALQLLEKFFRDIEDATLGEKDKNEVLAKAYSLIGLCRIEKGKPNSSFVGNIQSYKYEPSNASYKERACVSYYYSDEKEKSLEIANELLVENRSNERASAIKLFLDASYTFAEVPQAVKSGITFKRIYSNLLLSSHEGEEKVAELLFSELSEKLIPLGIDFENADYWDLVGRFSFHKGIKNQPNAFSSGKENYSGNELIKYSNKLLREMHHRVKDTEIYKDTAGFKLSSFYYFYSEYLLNGQPTDVTSMVELYENALAKEDKTKYLFFELVVCLNQLHRYEEVLKLTASIRDEKDSYLHLMEFAAYSGLNKREEAVDSFLRHLALIDSVSDIEVNNLLNFFDLLIQAKKDVHTFYIEYIHQKRFDLEFHRILVFSYAHRYSPRKVQEVESHLTKLVDAYKDLRQELRYVILIVLHSLQKAQEVSQLIDKYHDWQKEELPLLLYTTSLLIIRSDAIKLLEVLKFRREHHPEERLLLEELKIQSLAENADQTLEISSLGRIEYPDNLDFEFYYIQSLYKKNNKAELASVLNEGLLEKKFNWRQKFVLSKILIDNDKKQLGLELFYRQTVSDLSSPVLKQHYFTLTTLIGDRDDIPWPDSVKDETVVQISDGERTYFIDVNSKTINENRIVKKILGLKVGEVIDVEDSMTHKKDKIKVSFIYDKYSGLTARITDELNQSKYTGMSIKSVKFDGSDPENISKKLIEEFGEAGDRNKIRRDEAFSKYYRGAISFTELVRSVSSAKLLDLYSFLTSRNSDGFVVIPLRYFNNIRIKDDTEFVIDLTTLPILKKISEDFPDLIHGKFVISQYAIEYIESELDEARKLPEEGLSVIITSSGVIPNLYPPEYKKNRIETFENILEWIKKLCETRISKEKLDMIIARPDLVKENDLVFNYFIDTTLLSIGRTLISDDRLHNTKFADNYLTVSLEYYLQYFYKDAFKSSLLPILIRNHYVGIRIYRENLEQEFKKPHYGGKSTFHFCLENLPFSINNDTGVFNDCLDFIKSIYSESMPLAAKKEVSQSILVNVLNGYPNFLQLRNSLVDIINSKFFLLQLYLPDVLDDFTAALEILNRTSAMTSPKQ